MTLLGKSFNNFLTSGHAFDAEEALEHFRFRMLNSIMLVIIIFSFLFGLMHDLGINDIGDFHGKVNYLYSFVTLVLMIWLRHEKEHFDMVVLGVLTTSLLAFSSALVFVTADEFRMIWFYLLIFVAYIAGGIRMGILFTVLSIADILFCHTFFELNISEVALTSATLGLCIGSLLALFYTRQVDSYNTLLHSKNRELQSHATQDYLTGILNRRVFLQNGQRYFEKAQREDTQLAFIMLDIDHFKQVNDTYGHSIGDNVLMLFADTVQASLRKEDLFGRLGGEEFGIMLYESDEYRAEVVAEKVRKSVAKMSCPGVDRSIRITTSIGIALLETGDTHLRDLQGRADKALYNAKNSGRNRTALFIADEDLDENPVYVI
ncbi:MAG: GGDEF domain-containing protein [Sulfurimonadaceae bacterium]|nr:GGDEF domain-containing protein [Sulfurimonadaceae bacterium]